MALAVSRTSTLRRTARALPAIAVVFGLFACRPTHERPFWRTGDRYDLELVVKAWTPDLPGLQTRSTATTNALTLRGTVDSVRADTAFVTCAGDRDAPGVTVGRYPFHPHQATTQAIGVTHGSALTLSLAPGAIDASLRREGRVRGTSASGLWLSEAPPTVAGEFTIRSRP